MVVPLVQQFTYGQLFQIGLLVQFIVMVACAAAAKTMRKDHPYRPLLKALTVVVTVSFAFLLVSYVAQATFMGWI